VNAKRINHVSIPCRDLDESERFYRAAFGLERGAIDDETHTHPIWELPDGSVQMYARDPAGNLIEIDWPDVTTLDRTVVGEIPRRADDVPQSAEALTAKLYTT
jgi:hypothetical protein